jgi:hypothetical protein
VISEWNELGGIKQMSDEKPIESTSADDPSKTKKPGDVQLNEEQLKDVSAGGINNGAHIDNATIVVRK